MKTEAKEPIQKDPDFGNIGALGLTKREYFAAMALSGYMSYEFAQHQDAYLVAEYAVQCADALILSLNKTEG